MISMNGEPIRGRGAQENLPNRFEKTRLAHEDGDYFDEERPNPQTKTFTDHSKSVLNYNDSPDIAFDVSINPYRGCEHGCAYCYARPTHEYLGLSAGLDFETKIFVKENAPKLLRKELESEKWKPQMVAMSGVTDCYQPIERTHRVTRRCIEVLTEFRNPYGIVTKNHLVTRDIDLHSQMAKLNGVVVYLSITSLDQDLTGVMEPRTSRPSRRLEAIRLLSEAGVPTGVLVAPTIPGLNDHEVPAILEAASSAGARFAGFVPLRLPYAVAPLFEKWLESHFPDRKEKVLERIRSLRDGKLNDSTFGQRMTGRGPYADQIANVFKIYARRYGLNKTKFEPSFEHFRRILPQMSLFDGF